MYLLPVARLAISLVLVELSLAIFAPAGALGKREDFNLPPSDQFIACPGYRYSRPQAESAIQAAIDTTADVAKKIGYPHKFGNNKKLKFSDKCKGQQLYEFPLLPGSKTYSGGNPGADRVVYYIHSNPKVKEPMTKAFYCGVMIHDGARRGEFALCPVED
ncbi:ribonuclease T1 [Madurella fahalii]|uniref:ribonuclease T1 n=1 Tax=Madurella fahalii TaxID=1157608 RepID=A0ABQ0GHB7_9PEZI